MHTYTCTCVSHTHGYMYTCTHMYECVLGVGRLTMASVRGKEETPWRAECGESHEERRKQAGEPEVTSGVEVNNFFPLTVRPVHFEGLHGLPGFSTSGRAGSSNAPWLFFI